MRYKFTGIECCRHAKRRTKNSFIFKKALPYSFKTLTNKIIFNFTPVTDNQMAMKSFHSDYMISGFIFELLVSIQYATCILSAHSISAADFFSIRYPFQVDVASHIAGVTTIPFANSSPSFVGQSNYELFEQHLWRRDYKCLRHRTRKAVTYYVFTGCYSVYCRSAVMQCCIFPIACRWRLLDLRRGEFSMFFVVVYIARITEVRPLLSHTI